jgi:excinuclease UvrABC nuclease subunit
MDNIHSSLEDAFQQIESTVNSIETESLPSIDITDIDFYRKLPTSSGLYFIKKDKDLLYVGKAVNLRNRFTVQRDRFNNVKKTHHIVEKAIGCKLYYLTLNKKYITIAESILLKSKVPIWNVVKT